MEKIIVAFTTDDSPKTKLAVLPSKKHAKEFCKAVIRDGGTASISHVSYDDYVAMGRL